MIETAVSGSSAPKEWLSLSPYSAYPLSLVDGACAGVDRVSCQDPLPSGKCTYDRPEIPHPSFRVLPPEPRFARVLGQCKWF